MKAADLKKQIFVAPFSGLWPDGDPDSTAFSKTLSKAIARAGKNLIFSDDSALAAAAAAGRIGPTGCVNPTPILEKAAEVGVTALVIGCFEEPETTMEKRGIYGFRSTCPVTSLSLRVWVYEVRTQTKALDTVLSAEWVKEKEKARVSESDCVKALAEKLADDAGKAVAEALGDVPWMGLISASDAKEISIAAGSDTGLVAGACLSVFSPGQVLAGTGDSQYCVPGPLIGRVRLTQVSPRQSKAALVYGAAPQAAWVGLD